LRIPAYKSCEGHTSCTDGDVILGRFACVFLTVLQTCTNDDTHPVGDIDGTRPFLSCIVVGQVADDLLCHHRICHYRNGKRRVAHWPATSRNVELHGAVGRGAVIVAAVAAHRGGAGGGEQDETREGQEKYQNANRSAHLNRLPQEEMESRKAGLLRLLRSSQ